jgi:hypothetical protein
LILVLLFLNLAFYAWVQLIGEPSRQTVPAEPGPPIPRLQLASELQGRAPAARCTTIGPFADQAVAERAVLWLRGEKREPRLRTTSRDAGTGYWVMLDTPTMQQAARVSLRLRAAGVADVELLQPAADATRAVLSLGIYADRANAERRAAELQKYAIEPRIVEQPRQESAWWIDVDATAGARPLDVAALEKAVDGARNLTSQTCPAVTPAAPAATTAPATPADAEPAPSRPETGPSGAPADPATPGSPAAAKRVAYG